jgi:hypothetical protein
VHEASDQRSNLIVLPATLKIAGKFLPTYATTETGADGKVFIDQSWATSHRLPSGKLERPVGLELFDGREAESGLLTDYVTARMRIEDHYKEIRLYVTRLAHHHVILGMPWMKQHDSRVGFASHTLTFYSKFCRKHCNTPGRPSKTHALHDVPTKTRPQDLPARLKLLENKDIARVSLRDCAVYALSATVWVHDPGSIPSSLTHRLVRAELSAHNVSRRRYRS